MTRKWVSSAAKAKLTVSRRQNTIHSLPTIVLLLSCIFVQVLANQEPSPNVDSEQNSPQEVGDGQPTLNAHKRASISYAPSMDNFGPIDSYLPLAYTNEDILNSLRPNKRGMEDAEMPGVLRFGKRSQAFIRFGRSANFMDDGGARMLSKKEMPGVLRFGKRDSDGHQEKKAVPGVLRFGKRDSDIPGVLRFGKRDGDIPGVLRFGKRDGDMPGVLRFGKRLIEDGNYMPAGVLRFGKRDGDMPGVLRFGKKSDMPGVLRFGKRSGDMPGVLRFG